MQATTEDRLARIEATLGQFEKRFGSMEQAMNRLTWTVTLWGSVISILVGLMLAFKG